MTPGIPWVARWAACIAISAGWVLPATAGSDVNSWTKSSSGYWEEPFWSTGQLPSYADAAIMITNAGWKALAIGSGTTANYPNSLHIKSLTVDAPVDSHNLLLLNWAGVSVPLQADSMTVGTNGSLESHSSAMDVGTLRLDSQAVFADFGQSRFGSVQVGRSSPAQLNLSNGWFSADELSVASGAVSTFNQSGGSNQVSGRVSIDSEGFYNLSDGNFKAAFIDLAPTRGPGWGRPPHTPTAPRFIVTGGRAEVEGQLTVGGFLNADFQPGLLQLSGGFFKGGDILVIQGDVVHTGGTNQLSQLSLSPAEYDTINYVMSGGRLESARLYLGDASSALGWSAQGVFTQSAGV